MLSYPVLDGWLASTWRFGAITSLRRSDSSAEEICGWDGRPDCGENGHVSSATTGARAVKVVEGSCLTSLLHEIASPRACGSAAGGPPGCIRPGLHIGWQTAAIVAAGIVSTAKEQRLDLPGC